MSKFLSLVLRHRPETIKLTLDPQGWASINELIQRSNKPLTRELLYKVVDSNDKQRFAISEDGMYIRANQGHSITIDLGLNPLIPPSVLFHGTSPSS